MNNLEYIKGEYKRNIFQSSTGYVVGLFKVKETSENIPKAYINTTITFTGYFHELNDIDTYIFYGKFIEYGKTWILLKAIDCAVFRVCSNNFSSSPGKPTIMSVEIEISGLIDLICFILFL